jgi:nitric oxide dioxygenase
VKPATDSTKLGLMELDDVEIPTNALAYICGPLPFMDSVREKLLARGLPEANIHYEVFGPNKWLLST